MKILALIGLCLTLVMANAPSVYADDAPAGVPALPLVSHQLKVVTLNTWLLAFMHIPVGKDMPARAAIIGRMISQTGADLVALQESWPDHDKLEIINEFRAFGYPYSYYQRRGLSLGNGLVLISKFPIIRAFTSRKFREVTQETEIFAKKAAIYAEIEIAPGFRVDFFTTHMGALTYKASYGTYDIAQKRRQLRQYLEFRNWILQTKRNSHVIVAGDFNADYHTLQNGQFLPEYSPDYLSFIKGTCGDTADLSNSYLTANHLDETSPEIPTYDFNLNPYAASGLFAGAPSETEDYIFSCGFGASDIASSEVIFREPVPSSLPELQYYSRIPLRISDHFGLTTTFNYAL